MICSRPTSVKRQLSKLVITFFTESFATKANVSIVAVAVDLIIITSAGHYEDILVMLLGSSQNRVDTIFNTTFSTVNVIRSDA